MSASARFWSAIILKLKSPGLFRTSIIFLWAIFQGNLFQGNLFQGKLFQGDVSYQEISNPVSERARDGR